MTNAGAVTFGNGGSGTSGAISSANSVVGTVTGGVNIIGFDATRNRLVVGRAASNRVSILFFNTTAIADGSINDPAAFDNGLPNELVSAIIPNGRTVTLNAKMNIGLVTVECGGSIVGGSINNYIVGSVRKDYCAAANQSFVYPVGDPNNYSPVTTANVNGTGNLTVAVTDRTLPDLPPSQSVSRFWSLTGVGITTDLTFAYTNNDVNSTETAYKVFRRASNVNTQVSSSVVSAAANTITVTGISNFSDWGISTVLAPTAAAISISGRVTTLQSLGLTNALVTLTDTDGDSQTVRTGKSGAFRFTEVAAGKTYVLSVRSKRYSFAPRFVTANENLTDVNFTANQ